MTIDLVNPMAKQLFGMTIQEAHSKGICIRCQEPALVMAADGTSKYNPELFYSPAGKQEWKISGICEKCFDNMFGEEEQ